MRQQWKCREEVDPSSIENDLRDFASRQEGNRDFQSQASSHQSDCGFRQLSRQIYMRHTHQKTPPQGYQMLTFVITWTIYIALVAIYGDFFTKLGAQLASSAEKDILNGNWNFGQIVALSLWAPPLCEYFYLELRGIQKGMEYRLQKKDYVVVKASDEIIRGAGK